MGRAFEYRRAAKEARWDKMSKLFPKLAKTITVAAKEGGSDPEMNPKLRTAIQNAKAQNMPKDNIEAAIKRADGKDADQIVEVTFEGKGHHGVAVFVECATDNNTRTVANVKMYFSKYGQGMVHNGSFDFMFDRKAVFEFKLPESIKLDDVELELIDAGMEELEEQEGVYVAYADYKDFGSLSKALEQLGIQVTKANLKRIPSSPVELSEEQVGEVEELIDKLEDDDDVQAVFTNIN